MPNSKSFQKPDPSSYIFEEVEEKLKISHFYTPLGELYILKSDLFRLIAIYMSQHLTVSILVRNCWKLSWLTSLLHFDWIHIPVSFSLSTVVPPDIIVYVGARIYQGFQILITATILYSVETSSNQLLSL